LATLYRLQLIVVAAAAAAAAAAQIKMKKTGDDVNFFFSFISN
jgi:hypothetical protein